MCNLSPRYVAHLRDHLRGVLHTAEIVSVVCTEMISAVCNTPPRSSLRYVAHRGDNFVIEYLDEIETEFENTLACLSGAQMVSNHEKKLEVENLVTHSL